MSLPFLRVRPEEGGDFYLSDRSIAVSVIVTPSRIIKIICLSMSVMLFVISMASLCYAAPDLSFPMRAGLSGFAFFSAVLVLIHSIASRPTARIDISGQGQIRLALCGEKSADSSAGPSTDYDCSLRLQPGSFIFSSLLLLRLKGDKGQTSSLLILPDCVSSAAFRRLSVACRWIAVQNQRTSKKNH
ncbi:MAG: toxin CptA [Bradyrhizobium sp.]|jgi:toxin CptA